MSDHGENGGGDEGDRERSREYEHGREDTAADRTRAFEYSYGEPTDASIALVRGIATLENVDPVDSPDDLGFALHDFLDPEALDRLVDEWDGPGTLAVEFPVEGRRVRIEDSGSILVVDRGARDGGDRGSD